MLYTALPAYAQELQGRVARAWPAMGAFFEEDTRIMAHAERFCPAGFVINTIVPRESDPDLFKVEIYSLGPDSRPNGEPPISPTSLPTMCDEDP
jgi:hypothetical protein